MIGRVGQQGVAYDADASAEPSEVVSCGRDSADMNMLNRAAMGSIRRSRATFIATWPTTVDDVHLLGATRIGVRMAANTRVPLQLLEEAVHAIIATHDYWE